MPNPPGQARPGLGGARNQALLPRNRNHPPLQPRPSSYGASSQYSTTNGSAPAPKVRRMPFGSGTPPTGQRDRGHSLRELSHERQAIIETAAEQLANWSKLAMIAMARGESIPQTRMYLTEKIIRAGDPTQPLYERDAAAPNPTVAYVPRYHDPPPVASGTASGGSAESNHATAKKDARRREEARAIHIGRGADESNDRGQGWQEVHGLAWEDLQEFEKFGSVIYPSREESSSPTGAIASDKEFRRTSADRGTERRQEKSRASPRPKNERK